MTKAFTPDTSFFHAAVENSYDVVELIRKDGTILYISPSITRIIGLEPEGLIGTNGFDRVHPQDLARLQEDIAGIVKQGRGEMSPYRCCDSQGRWHWIRSMGFLLDSDVQAGSIVINSRDITEQEESRQALVKANQEMGAIWESISDAFIEVDNQWCITRINGAVENLNQQPREQLIGRNLWDLFPEAINLSFFRNYHRAVQEQIEVSFEEFYPPFNKWFEVRAYPSGTGLALYFRDTTQRKQIEESLRESEERFRRIFEEGPVGIAMVSPDTSLIHANAKLCQMLGYSEQELRDLTIAGVTHPDDMEADTQLAQQLIAGDIPSFQLEKRYIAKDGRIVWGSLTGALIRNEEGQPLCGLGIVEDITERKQAQELRTRLAAIVESSEDAISSLNVQGIITSWNCGAERLYGYTAAEAVGQSITLLAPRQQPDEFSGFLDKLRHGESINNLETQRRRKNGDLVDILLSTSPMFDATGQLVGNSAIARNISERKRAEEALRYSEKLYHTLAKHFPNGSVYLLDRESRVLVAEGRGLTSVGLSPLNMIGKLPREIFEDPELCETLEASHQRALQGEEITFETRLHGRLRLVQLAPVQNENGEVTHVLAMTQDITERKEVEERLRQSETNLAQAQQIAHLGSWELDLSNLGDIGSNPLHWSDENFRLFGYEPGQIEVTNESFFRGVHPDDRERVGEAMAMALRGEALYDIEHRIIWPDGSEHVIHGQANVIHDPETGTPLKVVGTGQDITQRVRAEEALRASEARFRTLIQSSWDVFHLVGRNGKIVYESPAVTRVLGYLPEEMEGSNAIEFVHPDDLPQLLEGSNALLESPGSMRTIVLRVRHKDGSWRWVESFEVNLMDHPDVGAIAVNYRDITDYKRAQDALEKSRDELEMRVAQRTQELEQANIALKEAKEEADAANRAKSEFLSRMSHELRTPLNAILGFGQILEMHGAEASVQGRGVHQQQEYLQQILKGGHHLLGLIDEVLDISRVETGHLELYLEALDLEEVVGEVCALVQPLAAQRRVRLDSNRLALKGHAVLADHQRLKQVLLNLLSNAIKYNREGGQVVVSCESRSNNSMAITVHDTGMGIAPQDLPKLFRPFERLGAANLAIEGTGLGLALSQRLVTAMEGTLDVESVVGRGTTFTINIARSTSPVREENDLHEETVAQEAVHDVHRSSSVLCIEDNPSNLRLIKAILQRRPGITLLPAIQGSVGLELARQHLPDLILLDSQLPDIPGQEVLQHLQQSDATRDIPVIVISADATERQIQQFMDAGAKAYLTKPFNIANFVRLLDEMIKT